MKKLLAGSVAIATLICAVLAPRPAGAQDLVKIPYAIPNLGVSGAYMYVALAGGYFKEQGLDVEPQILGGVNGTQGMLAGDVKFALDGGTSGLLMASRGQPAYAISNVHSAINFELLLSTEMAKRTGLDLKASTQQDRAKALKSLTIGVEGTANSITDAFTHYIVKNVGGLSPDTDVTIAYIPSGSGASQVQSHRVDAVVSSPPFTNTYEHGGALVDWVGNARGDLKQLVPFVFDIIEARKDYCAANGDICRKVLIGVQRAVALMRTDPEKGLQMIAPTYKDMNPDILREGYYQQIAGLNTDHGKLSDAAYKTTQDFAVSTGLLKPDQTTGHFEGTAYTNAFAP